MECKRIRCCCCLTKRQLPFARIKQVPADRIRDSECLVRLNMRSFSSLKEHGKTKQANNNNRKKGVSKEKADGAYKYKKQAVVQKSKKSQRTAKKGGDKQQQKSAFYGSRKVTIEKCVIENVSAHFNSFHKYSIHKAAVFVKVR